MLNFRHQGTKFRLAIPLALLALALLASCASKTETKSTDTTDDSTIVTAPPVDQGDSTYFPDISPSIPIESTEPVPEPAPAPEPVAPPPPEPEPIPASAGGSDTTEHPENGFMPGGRDDQVNGIGELETADGSGFLGGDDLAGEDGQSVGVGTDNGQGNNGAGEVVRTKPKAILRPSELSLKEGKSDELVLLMSLTMSASQLDQYYKKIYQDESQPEPSDSDSLERYTSELIDFKKSYTYVKAEIDCGDAEILECHLANNVDEKQKILHSNTTPHAWKWWVKAVKNDDFRTGNIESEISVIIKATEDESGETGYVKVQTFPDMKVTVDVISLSWWGKLLQTIKDFLELILGIIAAIVALLAYFGISKKKKDNAVS